MPGGAHAMLAAENLCAGYGKNRVLHGLNLALRAGECVALLGANGSGKTTLLRALSGGIPVRAERMEVQGRDFFRLRARERARMIAVVPQRGHCPHEMTVRQMVLLGRYPHLSWLGAYGVADHAAADRALEETGAAPLARRRLGELSGGELQRVLLARALAQGSPLLLLDELAAGLDPARMVELFDLLEKRRAAGACVLMAVHDCNLAAVYATRLVGLKAGQLLFDGPVGQTFTEENLGELYGLPVTVLPHPLWGLPQALLAQASGPHHTRAAGVEDGGGPAALGAAVGISGSAGSRG